MKTIFYILCLTIFFSCSKKESNQSIEQSNKQTVETDDIKNHKGSFALFLGIHNIEYFADRMVLKAKRAGYDFASKKSIGSEKWRVELGPFNSYEEVEKAERLIKELAPDTVSKILKK